MTRSALSKATFRPTAQHRAPIWKKRTASARAFSMSMRCAYRRITLAAGARRSLVTRTVGSSCPRSRTASCRQQEVDELWEKLSEGGEKQRCGWLKDKYGLSWQIIPSVLGRMLQARDAEKARRVMQELLQMDKLDIKRLQQAYERG